MSLVIDIETNGLYHEVTHIHCIVVKNLETNSIYSFDNNGFDFKIDNVKKAGTVEEGIKLLKKSDKVLIGHNIIDYDLRVVKKLFSTDLGIERAIDTLLLSHMLRPHLKRHPDCPASEIIEGGRKQIGTHSLKNWSFYLGVDKIDNEDWRKASENIIRRCVNDVLITEKLFRHFKDGK
jgi:hypothetical protein